MRIDIQGLRFRYPEMEKYILDDVHLQIVPGEKVCITGHNGSGKSTLISLLAALYTNQAGSIAYDGLPAGNIDTESLRDQIGACLTEEKIFQGTLAENIHLGRESVTLEAVRQAATEMGLDAFVQQLPQGFDTVIDPEGRKLPRSIIQKILLARAISNHPRLLLLEDAFEHIQQEEQEQLIEKLTDAGRPWTLVAASSNPVLAKHCHRVVTMKNGRIEQIK